MKSTYFFLLATLSQPVWSNCLENICIGNTVIDGNNRIGVVSAIKATGVGYMIGSWEYTASPSNLSIKVDKKGDISTGEVVVDSNNRIGKVTNIFNDGRIDYRVGSWDYISKDLVDTVESKGRIVVGTKVLDTNGRIGVANYIFRDGRINYVVGSWHYFSKDLSARVNEGISEYVVGRKIIDSNNRIGIINHVFENKKINYSVGGWDYFSEMNNLEYSVNELNTLMPGMTVIDSNNRIGKINTVFHKGKVSYSVDSWDYVSTNLSPEIKDADFNKGTISIGSDKKIVTVQRVFADKRVEVLSGQWSSITTKASLSKETESHSIYQKGVTYCSNSSIAEPKYFFENGLVALKGDSYGSDKLFSLVNEYENLKENSLLQLSAEVEGTVSKLCENGLIQFKMMENKKEVVRTAHHFKTFSKQDKDTLEYLLIEYLNILVENLDNETALILSDIVESKEKNHELNTKLLKLIKDKKVRLSRSQREMVEKFLNVD